MNSEDAALVLAAGLGSRLAPLTDELPKPIVPVGNVPLLLTILRGLSRHGFGPLAVNVHYQAEQIAQLVDGSEPPILVSREPELLGTAGGAKQAARLLGAKSLVVVNGDIFGPLPLQTIRATGDSGLTLAVVPRAFGTGTVGLGKNDEVVRLRGELFGKEVSSADYIGVARLGPHCLSTLPELGCLIGDWALPRLRSGGCVRSVRVATDFIDIGSLGAYHQANMRVVDQSGGSILAASAKFAEGVEFQNSILGDHVMVLGRGLVENAVILPGATVSAPLRNVVVTPAGKILGIDRPI